MAYWGYQYAIFCEKLPKVIFFLYLCILLEVE